MCQNYVCNEMINNYFCIMNQMIYISDYRMEWFSGDVGSAISSAKAKKAIFCVYITGNFRNKKSLG